MYHTARPENGEELTPEIDDYNQKVSEENSELLEKLRAEHGVTGEEARLGYYISRYLTVEDNRYVRKPDEEAVAVEEPGSIYETGTSEDDASTACEPDSEGGYGESCADSDVGMIDPDDEPFDFNDPDDALS